MSSVPDNDRHDENNSVSLTVWRNEGDSTRLRIALRQKSEHTPTTCWQLEDCLEACLMDAGLESVPSVRYVHRPDLKWLGCQKPAVTETETLLGLLECDASQPRDLSIHMELWVSTADRSNKTPSEFEQQPVAPHHQWQRTLLEYHGARTPFSTSPAPPLETVVAWVDFRWTGTVSLANEAAVTYFLRSLLGSAHDASPWVNEESKSYGTPLSKSDCVVVVFPSHAPPLLLDFRVSDVCPSWSLYSILSMQFPTDSMQLILPWEGPFDQEGSPAELLVFRKLPPRERLCCVHPETHERAPPACLWEQRKPSTQPTDDDDNQQGGLENQFRLVAAPLIDPVGEFPPLRHLVCPENFTVIQQEAFKIPQWTAWPEQLHYRGRKPESSDNEDVAPSWHVFPLCYSFPADNVRNRKWIPLTCNFVPQTVELLKKHLGDMLRTALFSRLDPGAVLEAHTGWEDLANHVYRVHLPLQVPFGGLCGVWVDGCVETHETGRLQAFDDSKIHRAFNYSSHDRVVLILDLARPADLPLGTATGGHTAELDDFIEKMGTVKWHQSSTENE